METKNNRLVYLLAILYAIIIGFSFLFTKIALESADPTDILSYRFTASLAAMLIPIIFKWLKLNYNKERIVKILPLALFYPLLFFGLQTFGLKYASSSEAGILLASSPIFTMFLARYFLKEKSSIIQSISIIISVSGVIYILVMKGSTLEINNVLGIILLILSALSLSAYSIMARKLSRDFTNSELSYIMIFISFICFNILSIGKHLVNGTLNKFFIPLSDYKFIIAILYLGILSTLVTSLITNYILSKIEASKMSVFSNLGTVISIIAGVIFLNEEIYYYHIIGSILIIAGVIGANKSKKII